MDNLADLAVKKSLEGKWKEALEINLRILKENSKDTEALCRLAKAYLELGDFKEAQDSYQKVLRLDKLNTIAHKNLERLKQAKPSKTKTNQVSPLNQMFLEEPGRTKTVSLVKIASPDILNALAPGNSVFLTPRQYSICISTSNGTSIGKLPDDLAARLHPMIKSGNTYQAVIRSINQNSVKVLIREDKRSKKFINTPSFPPTDHLSYSASISPELIPDLDDDGTPKEETEEEPQS